MGGQFDVTSVRFDGSQISQKEASVATFDGRKGILETTISSEQGVVISRRRRPTERFMYLGVSPFDFTTRQSGTPISDLITSNAGRIVEQSEWGGRSVVVVELAPVEVRDDYISRQRFWIDRSRNFLAVRRQIYVQSGKGKPWALHYEVDFHECKEISPGIWLPTIVDLRNHVVTPEGQGHLVSHDHIEGIEWLVNQSIDPSRFKLEPTGIEQIGSYIVAPDGTTDQARPESDGTRQVPAAEAAPEGFRYMNVRTIDRQGLPVAGTGIHVSIWPDGPYETLKKDYTTNQQGQTTVLVPEPPRLFRMFTHRHDYVPLFAQWWPEHQPDGNVIPDEFTFTLPNGTTIGGVIENEEGKPIEGAAVEVMLANSVDGMNRRPVPSIWLAETPEPGNNPCLTNAAGEWTLGNVPAGDDIVVRLKLTHPDYVSDPYWGTLQEEQSITMTSLRQATAKVVMQRGIVLHGSIRTPEGQPIPDAVVIWGDDPYLQPGSQEVRSDVEGVFRLAPLKPGPINLTVVASGWRPESRTVNVSALTESADFTLTKGNVLRIRFVDADGTAIRNVGVSIRGWRGVSALYNYKHPNVLDTKIPTRANADGLYEWTWAPTDAVDYSFGAKGFKAIDRTLVADQIEHIVTMEK